MNVDGQRRDHIKRGFKTRREAKKYENTILHQKDTGQFSAPLKVSKDLYEKSLRIGLRATRGL